jgi:D-aspartate ligase
MDIFDHELRKHKFIVFGFDHYNTLGVVRSLGEKGISPIVVLHLTHLKEHCLVPNSRYLSKIYIVDDVNEGYRIIMKEYSSEDRKPFLISCDDYVEMCLDSHYEDLKDKFYFFDGGQTGIISRYMDKYEISQLAVKCGCKVPKTEIVKRGQLPKSLKYPIITKAKVSAIGGWKEDVRICYSEKELSEAYKTILSEDLLVEEYIEKKNELCLDGFCVNHGEDVCIPFQTTYLRVAPGKYGNYMELTPFTKGKVYNQVCEILNKSSFNGIFSVEFLIDSKDELYFLEVNFRNSTWSYAFTYGGVNMPYEWAKATLKGAISINENMVRKEPFTAMVEVRDFKDFVLTGNVSFLKWIRDLIKTDCLYYWNKRDIKPVFSRVLHVILRKLNK